ncbi:hypothetical protein RSOLAG1IB_07116 [Rhizoctonia solani AG-1 IB]|uniref:Uncharacterized protein n=1 Tax=Thanatephorus cucumeris (strain AG1-IB / isolate 7/3/14) TaxID=1108050 RepID=A0A0B7FEB3_THACB|nr:hypothetical protein RSOLAG1IB_07116 [Rhizoctonia solani AG-1 IB]
MSVVAKTSAPAAESCSIPPKNPLNPQGLKPCCACPQTKSERDDCFLRYDPSEAPSKCADVLQKHIACMRSYGFNV